MKQDEWYRPTTGETILGIAAIKNRTSKEVILAGKYGQVWEYSENDFRCLVYAGRKVNYIATQLGKRADYDSGDEGVFRFDADNIKNIVKWLNIPKDAGRQLKYVNSEKSILFRK